MQYWNNGAPVVPDSDTGSLVYWLNGKPYVMLGGIYGWAGKIYGITPFKINGIAVTSISKVNGV